MIIVSEVCMEAPYTDFYLKLCPSPEKNIMELLRITTDCTLTARPLSTYETDLRSFKFSDISVDVYGSTTRVSADVLCLL